MIRYEHVTDERADVIRLRGELIGPDCRQLGAELVAILDGGTGVLLLDLHAVESIDEKGMSTLVKLNARARRRGGKFALVDVSPEVMTLLELMRLDDVFDMQTSDWLRIDRNASGFY